MTEATRRRGPYATTPGRRQQIVRAARESFIERGVDGASLRDIAARAGITHAGLLHHFSNKDELVVEVLRQRDREEAERGRIEGRPTASPAGRFLPELLREHQAAPEIMRLWGELTASASRPGHPAHAYFVDRYEQVRAFFAEYLLQEAGESPLAEHLDADAAAALLTAVMDGLQTQWLLNPDLDIIELLRKFLQLVQKPDDGGDKN